VDFLVKELAPENAVGYLRYARHHLLHRQVSSVPDPKLLITDPNPKIENQEFHGSGSGSFCKLEMVKKSFTFWFRRRHRWVEIFNFFTFSTIVFLIMMNMLSF